MEPLGSESSNWGELFPYEQEHGAVGCTMYSQDTTIEQAEEVSVLPVAQIRRMFVDTSNPLKQKEIRDLTKAGEEDSVDLPILLSSI